MTDLIVTEKRDDLLIITLNRPEKRNAINGELYAAFDTAVTSAATSGDSRVVLIRGAGPTFSAGIDVTEFMRLPEQYGADWQLRARRITADYQAVLNRLERLRSPPSPCCTATAWAWPWSWPWPAICASPRRARCWGCPKRDWVSSQTWAARRALCGWPVRREPRS